MWLCGNQCHAGVKVDLGVFVTAVVVASFTLVGIGKATGPSSLQSSDLCADDGAGIECGEGHVVHVQQMLCGEGQHECSPAVVGEVRGLCQGQSSCGGLGLRDIFTAHCHNVREQARHVVVRFSCGPIPSPAPPCRTNLCSNVTRRLSCPAGSVLHVRNLTCRAGMVTCSPPTFVTLFTLCEGRAECDASGLRMLPPLSTFCSLSSPPEFRNVFVDFLCVPDKLVWKECAGQEYRSLTEPFGVLMNPGFAAGGRRTVDTAVTGGEQCNWFLTPEDEARAVHVRVHMAYSKWSAGNCTANFLQVRYKDCQTLESRTRHFCDLHQVNSLVTSCGPVHVTSWIPSDQDDRFLLSYHMVQRGSEPGTPRGMAACTTALLTPAPTPPATRATTDRRNYGPGGTMFDYSDTIRHTGGDAETDEQPADGPIELKLIILYVFFGVIIIALIIALIYVLVSYRGISRRSQHRGDSSEKAALWRHDDTPLDTFNTNSHASLSDAASTNPHTSTHTPDTVHTPLTPDSQVVACTVHADPMPEEAHSNRFSSFLPGKGPEHNGLPTINPYGDGPRGGGGSLPRRWSAGSGGSGGGGGGMMTRSSSSTRNSSSFKVNGELGDIYENGSPGRDGDVEEDEGENVRLGDLTRPHYHNRHNQHHHHHHDLNHSHESSEGEETPLVRGAPPSPPLPPPPPPLSGSEGYGPSSFVEHYTVNNDEYALVRKPKSPNGKKGRGSQSSSPASPQAAVPHYTCAMPDSMGAGPDPAYNGVNIFQDKSGPVVGFRPTSGPYDRDRSSRSEPVSPSSGGTSRHRWDEL
ncbi:uncharacterized protein LOC143293450 [Babylonia areolata]|uniref:uncharacterized protein LOC143293450 n=1 Tax=Babylonia areolata TaxID=304850 RepID=UPI003FD4656F